MLGVAGKCILRVTKLKNAGGVSGMVRHNTRERDTPNADHKKLDQNTYLVGGSADQVMSVWRDRLAMDKNPRKNAVVGLDYMIHASPDALTPAARDKYLQDAFKWVVARHGRENIVQAVIHRDENTPAHLHVEVVPLLANKKKDLKLNASHWMDGKVKLSRMQTEFQEQVGQKYGLDRGLVGSKAKHKEVQKFYGLVKEPYREVTIEVDRPPRLGAIFDLDHWKKQQEEGLTEAVNKSIASLTAKARMVELMTEKAKQAEGYAAHLQREVDRLTKDRDAYKDVALKMPLPELARRRETLQQKQDAKDLERSKKKGIERD
jgi:hypothetical protein